MTRARRRKPTFFAAATFLVLFAASAAAQSGTASLEVRFEGPGPYPDRVRLERAGRLEREGQPDGAGRTWFLQLVPGHYQVRIPAREAAGGGLYEVDLGAGQSTRLTLAADARSSRQQSGPADRGASFADEELRQSPRPSDPWSLLRDVPGVVLDRVNVGGSETALQSLVVSHADPGTGTTWTVDGIDVTDPAAVGASALFPDVDLLSLVQVRTGTWDVRVRTPGAQVSLFQREPGPAFTAAAHLRGSDDGLQSDNLPQELRGRPFFRNRTLRLLEAGAEAGGWLRDRHLWLWAGASRNALRQSTFTEHEEELETTWVTGKARLSSGSGSLSLVAVLGEKVHTDRDTGFSAAPAARWRQSGPNRLIGLEDRRSLGRVALLSRLAYLDGGFRLEPQGGRDANAVEDFQGVFQGSFEWVENRRPRLQAGVQAERGASAGGFDHDLLAGVGYRASRVTTRAGWPGNQVLGFERQSVFFRTFRLSGFAQPTRDEEARTVHDHAELFAQDTARRGRLAVILGARLDRQAGRALASAVEANPLFPDLLPAVRFDGTPTRIRWLDLLPRAAVSWDLSPGRLRLQAGYAAYGAELSAAEPAFDDPIGREPASLAYFWLDRNLDHVVQADELDRLRGRAGFAGLDPLAPGSVVSPHTIDAGLRAPRTHELSAALVRSTAAIQASLHGWWRRQTDSLWRPLRNLTLTDYVITGAVDGSLFDERYQVGFFAPASASRLVSGNGRRLANREGYHQDAIGVDLDARGRLGRAVAWRAWAGLADWREFFDDVSVSIQDPTPLDTEPLQDAGRVAVRPGGLGRGEVFVNARWNAGATVSAHLPWKMLVAAMVYGRDGFPIPYVQVASTGDPSAGSKSVLVSPHLDSFRLPPLCLVDARLEKAIALRSGRLAVAIDAFNLLDRATTLQIARDVELPAFGRAREIVRPRIIRLGLDYRF